MPPEEVTAEDGAERLIAAVVDQKAFADSVELSARTLKTWNWTGNKRFETCVGASYILILDEYTKVVHCISVNRGMQNSG